MISKHSQEFRWLRTTMMIAIVGIMVVASTSCTVQYTKRPTPPPPPEPEVVYVEEPDPYPTAFPELERYGRWVQVEGAGWAWSPDVQDHWRPYYHGHWAWSNNDWTWVSYEPYGWAVYHYGNWSLDPYWGWLWFPDYEWQPHRATWVVYQDYVAWAPAPYTGYMIGDPWAREYAHAWNVCHVRDFTNPYVGDYHVVGFAPRHHRVNRYVITRAPEPSYIYQRCGVRVVPVRYAMRPVPGHDGRTRNSTIRATNRRP
jgi:hypothetical protein